MNKIRSINLTLNKQNSKTNLKTTTTLAKAKELTTSNQVKKKRTALENISNATASTKEEVSKKSRFSNPVFGLTLGKKDTNIISKKDAKTVAKENVVSIVSKTKVTTTTTNSVALKSRTANNATKVSTSTSSSMSNSSSLVFNCEKLEITDSTHEEISEVRVLRADQVEGWDEIDEKDEKDEFNVNDYVVFIFNYYREREDKFIVTDYLKNQPHLNKQMRHLLIDWMVEVQQQLEFNHEVLYLSVKLLDLYLNTRKIEKEKLQLLGGAAMLIASKFEERIPPVIDDFIYVSDNAYDRTELIKMEIDILKTIRFDLGVPLSYTFLRRYCKCLGADMKFLTLARYILELALQEYSFSYVRDSYKACAALYLALKMTLLNEQKLNLNSSNFTYTEWGPTFIHYTDAFVKDFVEFLPLMNSLVKAAPFAKYKTIHKKYSHQVFFEVAKISPLTDIEMENLISSHS